MLDVYEDFLSRGVLLPIVPLNELLVSWFTGEVRGHSACGVELATNFDLVGGRILACADLPPELILGEVSPAGEISWRGNGLLGKLVAYREILGANDVGSFPTVAEGVRFKFLRVLRKGPWPIVFLRDSLWGWWLRGPRVCKKCYYPRALPLKRSTNTLLSWPATPM